VLIRMMSNQVSMHYKILDHAIRQSLPKEWLKESVINNIFDDLLADKMQAWVYKDDERTRATGVLVTLIRNDSYTDEKELVIYVLYGFHQMLDEFWVSGYDTLKKFAKGAGCTRITAYTKVRAVVERARQLGGDVDTTFLVLEV